MFTEGPMTNTLLGSEEMSSIGAVITNRFNLLNGYARLPSFEAPSFWGTKDNSLGGVLGPNQFQVWSGPGGTLATDARDRLKAALASDADSNVCAALYNTIRTGLEYLGRLRTPTVTTFSDTNVVYEFQFF